jgi:hypothetical protein
MDNNSNHLVNGIIGGVISTWLLGIGGAYRLMVFTPLWVMYLLENPEVGSNPYNDLWFLAMAIWLLIAILWGNVVEGLLVFVFFSVAEHNCFTNYPMNSDVMISYATTPVANALSFGVLEDSATTEGGISFLWLIGAYVILSLTIRICVMTFYCLLTAQGQPIEEEGEANSMPAIDAKTLNGYRKRWNL